MAIVEERCRILYELEQQYGQEVGAEFVEFGGLCPFMACLERGPHQHYICPTCGAVRFGNAFCPMCKVLAGRLIVAIDQHVEAEIKRGGEGDGRD